MSDDHDPFDSYHVVINHEEQYSIWPVGRPIPGGWNEVGFSGTRDECLDHIEQVWTDMRPLSLRRFLEEQASNPPPEPELIDLGEPLVDRLVVGDHPLQLRVYPEPTADFLQQAVDRRRVFIRFTGTKGETELSVDLDPDRSDLDPARIASMEGRLRVVGDLVLDYEPVTAIAEVDLPALTGTGRLERRDIDASASPQTPPPA